MSSLMEIPEKLTLYNDREFKKKQGMSQTDYGLHRGISKQAVFKHKMSGRLVLLATGYIDVEASDKLLDACLDPSFTGNAEMQKGRKKKNGGMSPEPESLSDRRLYRLNLQIQREETLIKKDAEELVEALKIKNAEIAKVHAFRDRMRRIPDRIDAKIAAESDQFKCNEIVKKEINNAMLNFGSCLDV